MAKVKGSDSPKKMRPALTPEARENQLISLAVDLVEKRLRDGSASSQETTHFLKLGSTLAVHQKERLIEENKLLRAKTEALEAEKVAAVKYEEVLKALRNYNGMGDPNEY